MLIHPPKKYWRTGIAPFYKASPSYAGPGDVVPGAYLWSSPARAYSAAYAASGGPAMDIVDSSGANTTAINVLSTGLIDLAAIASFVTAHGTPKVAKLYDQTGNGRHFTQATLANMPGLQSSAVNGLPALTAGGTILIATATLTLAQPFSASTVYIRNSGTAIGAAIGAGSGAIMLLGTTNIANGGRIGGTTPVTFAASDNAWHALSGAFNGASSAYNIDGSDATSQNFGTANFSSNALRLCTDGANALAGMVAEGGVWPFALTATQRGNLNTNQHGANGYNF